MHKKYTKMAEHVLEFARHESKRLKHGYVGTEHLLLGLIDEKESVAAKVLEKSEVSYDKVYSMIEELINPGTVAVLDKNVFSPRAEKILNNITKSLQI